MSANNQLVIYKEGKKFVVRHIDVDTGGEHWWEGKKEFDTLEEAIKAANKFQKKYEVEYGLAINL